MLVDKTKENCSQSLHKNGCDLPEEKNLFVPVHQHGRHDVTYKPSISGFFDTLTEQRQTNMTAIERASFGYTINYLILLPR